jgi:ABC-type spermidine/putrescine transport system permease subunit II
MALGLTLAHLVRRPWRAVGATLLVMIALPNVALGVAFFYLFVFVIRIQLNRITQLIGHVTVALPFVALIIRTRMLFLNESYDEQAADLGAPPWSTVTRVLVPLCARDHRSGDGCVRSVVQRAHTEPVPLHATPGADAPLTRALAHRHAR